METPEGILCAKTHEWILQSDENIALIGLCDWKVENLGDIVGVDLPEINSIFDKDEVFAIVESVRQAYEICMPVSGTVVEVNEKLINSPDLINESPFESWFVKVKCNDFNSDTEGLMEYSDYIEDVS